MEVSFGIVWSHFQNITLTLATALSIFVEKHELAFLRLE
jgi:hypothetical protein